MKIKYPPNKVFIMSMIRDHLLSYRLLQGLEKIGFDTTNFDLRISDNIFSLLGFGNSTEEEKLFENFLNWSEKVTEMEFSIDHQEALDKLCNQIYKKLKQKRKLRKSKKR